MLFFWGSNAIVLYNSCNNIFSVLDLKARFGEATMIARFA